MRSTLIPLVLIALLCACSRQQQPMVEAVKPMQQSVEKAKGVEQTVQKAHEAQQQSISKE